MPYRQPAENDTRVRLHDELARLRREIERANQACLLLGSALAATCGLFSVLG